MRHLGGRAGEGDPVAADVHGGVEGPLDQPEVLVTGPRTDTMSMLLGTTTVWVGRSCWVPGWFVAVMDARDGRPSGSVMEPLHATEPVGARPTSMWRSVPDQGRVTCSIPRHISSVVPSPHTT